MGRPQKHFPHTKLIRCVGCRRVFAPIGAKTKCCTIACIIAATTTINHETGCLEWQGYRLPSGHGQLKTPGRGSKTTTRVHVYVYELHRGPIENPKLVVRHKCDNASCCNIDHLEIGTQADNVADAVKRERHARGSRNGHAKTTEDDVRAIREARRNGATYAALQERYGLTFPSISGIIKRLTWRHVE